MASYQQPNDYQTYQVNPYQAPSQEMVQAIATRQNYWDSAATSVKNAYQNYLNLDLSRQDNHERLNQLMTGVNQQLKQVSQTDLSLGENYGKALSIFDPITKDDNIMGDNAITKFYKDQFSTAQQYRIKDNGKGYSDTNVRDLNNHLQDFVNDPNAANWRQHYSQRAFYTPYYDTSAEIRQIDKDFKPSVLSSTAPVRIDANGQMVTSGGTQSGYMLSQTDKSVVASQYRAFLTAHLSDKAKDQLSIEGRVKYHDNIGALAQDYTEHNQDKVNYFNDQIKDLNGRIAGATDDQKDAFRGQINNYQAMVKELTLENTKMRTGDFSNLTPYKNQIASQLYTDSYVDYLSKASARKDIDVKYTPDQVWKTMYQEDNENKRFNVADKTKRDIATWNNNTKLEIAGLRLNGLNTPGLSGIPDYAFADKSNNSKFSRDEFDKMQTSSATDFSSSVDTINRKILSDKGVDVTDTKVPQATRDAAFESWMNDPRNKSDVDQYKMAAGKRSSEQQTFGAINDFLDQTLKTKFPTIYNGKQSVVDKINSGDTIQLTDTSNDKPDPTGYGSLFRSSPDKTTLNLSAGDIKSILSGNHPNISLTTRQVPVGPGGPGGTPSVANQPVLNYKGNQYTFSTGSHFAKDIGDLNQSGTDYLNKRNELLAQNITRIMGIEHLYQNDKNPYYNAARNIATRQLSGGNSGVIKNDDIEISDKDRFGNVYVKVQGDAKANMSEIKTKAEALGGKYIESMDAIQLPGKLFGNITKGNSFDDPRLSSIQTLVDFRANSKPNDIFKTAPQMWGSKNFQFKVDVQDGHPSYKILDPNTGAIFGSTIKGDAFATLQEAAATAQQLGDLPDQYYTNQVRTIGGVPGYQPK